MNRIQLVSPVSPIKCAAHCWFYLISSVSSLRYIRCTSNRSLKTSLVHIIIIIVDQIDSLIFHSLNHHTLIYILYGAVNSPLSYTTALIFTSIL